MTSPAPTPPSWPHAARAVAEAVDVLVRTPMADLADAQLAEALEHAAVQASRLHAVAVKVTAEAGARQVWRTQGASSLRGWVRRCVQLADDAPRLVTAARMLAFMPRMATLFSAGQVSLAQIGAAARQVRRLPAMPAWQDHNAAGGDADPVNGGAQPSGSTHPPSATVAADSPDLAGGGQPATVGLQAFPGPDVQAAQWGDLRAAADDIFAGHAPAADAKTLAAIGEHIYAAADPGDHLGESIGRHERRYLSISTSFEGMGEVSGRLDPEATERALIVLGALSTAGPGDQRTAAQRRADAFDRLCRNWLESAELAPAKTGITRRDRVLVTIPYPALIGLPGASAAVLGNGIPIAAETARRLSCDASIRRVVVAPPLSPGNPHESCPCGPTCSSSSHGNAAARHGPATRTGHQPSSSPHNHNHTNPGRDLSQPPNDPGPRGSSKRPRDPGPRGWSHADFSQLDPGDTEPDAPPIRSRSPGFDPTAKLADILRAAISALPPPLGARSAVLDAGRSTPTFTQPMRDALHAQYGGRCTFAPCDRPATIVHHILHWSLGGPTSVANGAPVCEYHHYLVHEGGWRLCKNAQQEILATPPPTTWPGPRTLWRNGKPITGAPPDRRPPGHGQGTGDTTSTT